MAIGNRKRKVLPHTAYDDYRDWVSRKPEGHSELPIKALLFTEGYHQCGIQPPKAVGKLVEVKCVPDRGAQLTVTGLRFIHSLGVTKSELIPLSHGVSAANNKGLSCLQELS